MDSQPDRLAGAAACCVLKACLVKQRKALDLELVLDLLQVSVQRVCRCAGQGGWQQGA